MESLFESIESPITFSALLKDKKEGTIITGTILKKLIRNKENELKRPNVTPVEGVEIPDVPEEESFYFLSWKVEGLLPYLWVPVSKTACRLDHPEKNLKRLENESLVIYCLYGRSVSNFLGVDFEKLEVVADMAPTFDENFRPSEVIDPKARRLWLARKATKKQLESAGWKFKLETKRGHEIFVEVLKTPK
ncbi:hypothetical protein FPRO04_12451 [Fusarium proliferatum]|nr:hypothetical protein FPRO04_12451 [Fusarium proliferatum]